jgi:putative tricarboxylic transport membrane protein
MTFARRVHALLPAMLGVLLSGCTAADDASDAAPGAQTANAAASATWPSGRIRLITHSSPGGGGDIMARELARTLERLYDVTVVVENKVGGSGAVATVYLVNRAPKDGSTLQVITPTHLITPRHSRGVPTYRDVTPVANLVLDPTVIYVRRESPFATMAQMIAFAKAHPGALKWGIGSAGSLDHLNVEQIKALAGINVSAVPHEGGGDAMLSVLGGHIDAGLGEPIKVLSQLKAGNLRLLAVFDEKRLEEFPDVPAIGELGYKMRSQKFRGVWGPPGLSAAMVSNIADGLERAFTEEPFQSYWQDGGMQRAFLRGADFARFLAEADADIGRFLASH